MKPFKTYIAIASCLVLFLALAAPAVYAQNPEADALFKAKCVMCHGADAAGKTPMGSKLNIPDLRAPETQKKSGADLASVIAKGKNKMPAFEGKLTPGQLNQLATYVHGLKK